MPRRRTAREQHELDEDVVYELAREDALFGRDGYPEDDDEYQAGHLAQDRYAFLGAYEDDGRISSPAESMFHGELAQMYDAIYGKGR